MYTVYDVHIGYSLTLAAGNWVGDDPNKISRLNSGTSECSFLSEEVCESSTQPRTMERSDK